MTTGTLIDALRKSSEFADLIDFISSNKVATLHTIRIDWSTRVATDVPKDFGDFLLKRGWAETREGKFHLGNSALSILFKILVDLRAPLSGQTEYLGSYRLTKLLAVGTHSLTFLGEHLNLGSRWVLKFTPAPFIVSTREYFSRLTNNPEPTILTYPVALSTTSLPSENGDVIPCECLVFPFVEGPTLATFLHNGPTLTPELVAAFIRTMCKGLLALHDVGIAHGDFHRGNILVDSREDGSTAFRIIDLSPVPSDQSTEAQLRDFQDFRGHLMHLLNIVERSLRDISLRRHLGAEVYFLCVEILEGRLVTAKQVIEAIETKAPLRKWEEERALFLEKEFRTKKDYLILRYEEFTNARVAAEFFVPFPRIEQSTNQFTPIFLMGSRGSGKSSYLAAQAFFPEVTSPRVDHRKSFGIFFACRQGEFKPYASPGQDPRTLRDFKSVLVVKIFRRTIELIAEGIVQKRFRASSQFGLLRNFLKDYFSPSVVSHFRSDGEDWLRELALVLTRVELRLKDEVLNRGRIASINLPLDETDLQKFFLILRTSFSELSTTQFALLFDDAGYPNLSYEMQRALNDLVLCRNSVFCCKVSVETYSYLFEGSSGKRLEMPHDYTRVSISETMILKSGGRPERAEVLDHFEQVVRKRLKMLNYASDSVADYLGRGHKQAQPLIAGLHRGAVQVAGRHPKDEGQDKAPKYEGWSIVAQLSDRTIRHLLQLIDAIFEKAGVTATTDIRREGQIRARDQHKAILDFSSDKLRTLGYVTGEISLRGDRKALGQYLTEFVQSFGAVSRHFLQKSPPAKTKPHRVRYKEVLAIEVDSALKLSDDASLALRELVRYGVLDDSLLQFTRDDKTRKPIYVLNRIYTPALLISFRRDQDWRLSARRFEAFLMAPNVEARRVVEKGSTDLDQSEDSSLPGLL